MVLRKPGSGQGRESFVDEHASGSSQNGRMLATLATHGPIVQMPFERALSHVDRLRQAADELSKGLE